MRFFSIILLFIISQISYSQNQLKAVVADHHTEEPLMGANVLINGTSIGGSTDEKGYVEISNIPDGTYEIRFSYIGYKDVILEQTFPNEADILEIEMESEAEEIEEVSVSSTRSSRLISNIPTRVEAIAGEEIDEKISMDPSNISMMLNESTGIQVQQTSALSVNSSFRIQGLDGRYTQLLKDGFPLYTGFAGTLSILQIPPLDLHQIEIIKGSSSTLFGGGAIAGLINLISKTPDPDGELSFLINGTTASGLDLSGFYSKKFENTGVTLLISRNTQKIYDNNDDAFSDLPDIERYTITPKLSFALDEKNQVELGGSFVTEERTGGYIPLDQAVYSESNKSKRFSTQLTYSRITDEENRLILRNSFGYFERNNIIPDYEFSGNQLSSFTEAVYAFTKENFDWIIGTNLLTENFDDLSSDSLSRSYADLTYGIFAQAVVDFSEIHSLEPGLRIDYAKDYDFYILPRVSFMSKWNKSVTTRLGGGLGYKLPTLFTEDSEEIFYKDLRPLNKSGLKAEKSYGLNFDINYNTIIFDAVAVSFNNLFFYTRIHDPLVLRNLSPGNNYEFTFYDGYYHTNGLETNLKISFDHLKLFAGYTYTNVTSPDSGDVSFLTPAHRLGLVLIYEKHENFRIGLEAYFTGEQTLTNGETGRSYWINGIMLEKHFEQFSLFLNFENFLDVRQSKFGPMYTGLPSNPQFAEIYAPTDGRIINGGIKLRL